MSPTLQELRSAIDHGADLRPSTPTPALLDRLHRSAAARRRRRVARATLAVAAVLVLVASGVVVNEFRPRSADVGGRSTAPVAPSGLPKYAFQGRLLGSVSIPLRDGASGTFTITPTSLDVFMVLDCGPANYELQLDVVGGKSIGHHYECDGGMDDRYPLEQSNRDYWSAHGVRVGHPVVIRVTAHHAGNGAGNAGTVAASTHPDAGWYGLYQQVPWSQYPIPAKPRGWKPPTPDWSNLHDVMAVRVPIRPSTFYASGDNSVTWNHTMTYRKNLVVAVQTTAPGSVRVLLNGQEVEHYDFLVWKFDEHYSGLEEGFLPAGLPVPKIGSPVTVTIEFSNFSVPGWTAAVAQEP